MRIQVFQGTAIEQFQTLQQEGKVFTVQPVTVDKRNLMTSLRSMGVPLQPIAQVIDDNNTVRGLCFATGNGIELSETGAGYAVTYNGRNILTMRQSTEDGIGVAEIQAPPTGYAPSLSYPVEQVPYQQTPYQQPPYQQPPYQPQQPAPPPPPYQQPPYQGQPYPQQPVYQGGYDPNFFGAPVYPAPVPYVDYHEQQHLLHHYYGDHYPHHYGHGYGWGYGGGLGHAIHDMFDHDDHHD